MDECDRGNLPVDKWWSLAGCAQPRTFGRMPVSGSLAILKHWKACQHDILDIALDCFPLS